ncbi:MAG: DUF1189 domain-containing protein [Lachnospiraceae bacterium]|nr:DUF1189 domain-containing protein [Lachnospiraceae bacterium]
MNLFAEMIHAVYDFKSYIKLKNNSGWKVFFYGVLLSAVCVLVTTVFPVASVMGFAGNAGEIIGNVLPDFSLSNGTLWVEEPVEFKHYNEYQGGVFLKIDTSGTAVEDYTDVDLLAFDWVFMADSQNFLVKENGDVFRATFAEVGLGNWTKGEVLNSLLPYIEKAVWGIGILVAVVEIASFFAGALVVAMIGSFAASIIRYRIRFGTLYKVAVYTRTLPILLKIVSAWFPFILPFFFALNFGLSIWYIWKVLLLLKSQEEKPEQPVWTGEPK